MIRTLIFSSAYKASGDVERLEVLEEYAKRQQWDKGPQPERRSHVGATAVLRPLVAEWPAAGADRGWMRLARDRAGILSPCSPVEHTAHYATRRPPCCRPASRLADERVVLTRRRRCAAMPTDLDALLRRRECNRHTYSRLVPINASTTKAACDGECGRI
ncbi:unnamed protein product [Arctia plantaginis]|uniref:Uncharacterized protein n=1 Tax=Arctia plantaginis TaxID=874455 RepID=A0A8S0YQ16_ARCPL|nr:unnamed protein product [Arctia plantaginis]